jgi:hypothetical protein
MLLLLAIYVDGIVPSYEITEAERYLAAFRTDLDRILYS